jgi:hypothetical protein
MTVYTPKTTDGGHERDRGANRERDDRTMGEVSHTNPYTDESFGDSQVYNRGRVVVVDGGEAEAADEEEEETIGDIDHTPREDAPSTHEVYERGGEGPDGAETDEEADAEPEEDVAEVGEE